MNAPEGVALVFLMLVVFVDPMASEFQNLDFFKAPGVKMSQVRSRRQTSLFEMMEPRMLLSAATHSVPKLPAGWKASPIGLTHFAQPSDTGFSTPYSAALTPSQIRNAYGLGTYGSSPITFGNVQGDGSGQTIAIIDAYDDPNAVSDLQNFDAYYQLPDPPSFQKLNEYGSSTGLPTTDPSAGGSDGSWEEEESLDIEWSHVIAPMANIILYEASSSGNDLYTAIQTADANSAVSVISMSFGGSEFNGENSYDSTYFSTAGKTYAASTGDSAGDREYPAMSPDVVAIGGTTLNVSNGTYTGESAWSSAGSGISRYETLPAYQKPYVSAFSTKKRTVPDVSLDADPDTGVSIYDSFDFGTTTPWVDGIEGGTSLASPLFAGMIAIADQGHSAEGLGTLTGSSQVLPDLYALPSSNFHDITTGSNAYSAGIGYDLATGIGSPVANLLIPDLAGTGSITGRVFVDTNGDGIYDGTDTGLSGKTVYLDANNNGVQNGSELNTSGIIYTASSTASTGAYAFGTEPAGGAVRLTTALSGYVLVPVVDSVVYGASNTINIPLFPTTFSTTAASTNYTLQKDPTGTTDQILINGTQAYSIAESVVDAAHLTFSLTGTGDTFTINAANGDPVPTAGITVTGATTGDVLNVIGTATGNDAFTVTSNSITFGSNPISFSNISSLLLNPGAGLDSLAVNSGSVTVTAQSNGSGILTRNFSSLTVASAASALFATAPLHANRMLVETTTLSASGKLDLGGNDLIVHNGSLPAITQLLQTGFANGAWNGNGLSSSAAAGDTSHTTALGSIQNTLYGGSNQPLFDGVAPVATDVLVKFTYYGDTNLDGEVDASDYSRIDNGSLFNATGWFNGDFNYDGAVNGSDYTLIDNAFNTQGAQL